jgi:hypothetical protein
MPGLEVRRLPTLRRVVRHEERVDAHFALGRRFVATTSISTSRRLSRELGGDGRAQRVPEQQRRGDGQHASRCSASSTSSSSAARRGGGVRSRMLWQVVLEEAIRAAFQLQLTGALRSAVAAGLAATLLWTAIHLPRFAAGSR